MMNRILLVLLLPLIFSSCQKKKTSNTQQNSIAYRVDTLLAKMTLKEKIGQMNQYNGFMDFTGPAPKEGDAVDKLQDLREGGVGAMLNVYGAESVRKVQQIAVEETRLGIPLLFGFDVIHGFKTISPIPLAEAASWDMETIEKSARIAAEEASSVGINWGFAPMVDITRDARWGRVMEGAGEDPYLGSKIAEARVRGFQGEDLSSPTTIAASVKHFAGYGFPEAGKDYNTVDFGLSTLYNVVLPPFQAAVKADTKTIMNAFNIVDGIPATANSFLQRDILKDRWGFEGFVVSDWGSIFELIPHGFAKDGRDAAKKAVLAGSDMDMESYFYINELEQLVADGEVDESLIDDAVRRILTVKFELGLFEDPYRYVSEEREKETVYAKRLQDSVLDIAKKSIVLLKNEDQLLPLDKDNLNIGIIGELGNDKTSPLGNWRIAADDSTAISVVEGFKNYKSTNRIHYSKGVKLVEGEVAFPKELKINTTDRTGISEAVALAKKMDVVILVLGEHGLQSGEGRSRAKLDLPGLQQELLEAIYKANPNIVLVLQNGRPLAIPWAVENIPAIVEAWHLGSQSGNAIAQVLYGDYNPSGKLPMSFPRSVGQMPLYYNHMSTGRPNDPGAGEVFWTHFTDEKNSPLFPFGYGLSYTQFSYSNLSVENNYEKDSTIHIKVRVKNIGDRKGKTTTQVYLRDKIGSTVRPVRSLKQFKQVELEPGETREVEFTLGDEELGFYNNQGEFIVEEGDFEIFVGQDSSATLSKEFSI